MSRSKRKIPIIGMCSIKCGAQKKFKRSEHRRERSKVKQVLINEQYDELPHPKKYGNEWASPRDGKGYFQIDRKELKKYLRK